jgi:hypothetical protein
MITSLNLKNLLKILEKKELETPNIILFFF